MSFDAWLATTTRELPTYPGGGVAPRDIHSTVERDAAIEAYLDKKYPHWRKSA